MAVKKEKRMRKIKDNDFTKNKEVCDIFDKMLGTKPITDEELSRWVKEQKDGLKSASDKMNSNK